MRKKKKTEGKNRRNYFQGKGERANLGAQTPLQIGNRRIQEANGQNKQQGGRSKRKEEI